MISAPIICTLCGTSIGFKPDRTAETDFCCCVIITSLRIPPFLFFIVSETVSNVSIEFAFSIILAASCAKPAILNNKVKVGNKIYFMIVYLE